MNHFQGILLSIAIPTKNRNYYLKILIEELLTTDRCDFEIVIQDNSDHDELGAWIAGLNDSRVQYNYHPGWISVVDNCDKALQACVGDYVCMLGDDDGILLDETMVVLAEAKRDKVDAVMGPVLNYVWPDLEHRMMQQYGGKLYVQPIKGNTSSNDFKADARKVVRRGGAMGLQNLPCVYHGFISRRALTALFELTGSYFPGPSPDMANAIGLCAVLSTLRRTTVTLVITGHSMASGAGAGTARKHHGPISAQRHLPSDTAETWYADIPFFWSGPTIYAQSLSRALERTGNTELGSAGRSNVYAASFIFNTNYSSEVLKAIHASNQSASTLVPEILYYMLLIFFERARIFINKFISRYGNKKNVAIEAETISVAIRAARSLSIKR